MNKLNTLKQLSISLAMLACLSITGKIGAIEEQIVATGHSDGTIKIWDINKPNDQENICNIDVTGFRTSDNKVGVKISPFNKNILASCNSLDNDIQILDISNRNNPVLNYTLTGHTDKVSCITFSPISRDILASGSEDGTIKIWDLSKQGNKCINTITFEQVNARPTFPTVLLFSPVNKDMLIAGSSGNAIQTWNISTQNGRLERIFKVGSQNIISLEFDPFDPKILLSLDYPGAECVHVWDLSRNPGQELLRGNPTWNSSISLNPFNPNVLACANNGNGTSEISMKDFNTRENTSNPIIINSPMTMLIKFSPFKENILVAATRRTTNEACQIEVLNISRQGNEVIKTINIQDSLVTSMDFMKPETKEEREFKAKLIEKLKPLESKHPDFVKKTKAPFADTRIHFTNDNE